MKQEDWDDLRKQIEEYNAQGINGRLNIPPGTSYEDMIKNGENLRELRFVGKSFGKNFEQLQDLVAQIKAKQEEIDELGGIIHSMADAQSAQVAEIDELRAELNNCRPSLAHAVADANRYGAMVEDIERLLKREGGVILLQWNSVRGKFVAFHHMATDMRGEGDNPVEALDEVWRTLRYHSK